MTPKLSLNQFSTIPDLLSADRSLFKSEILKDIFGEMCSLEFICPSEEFGICDDKDLKDMKLVLVLDSYLISSLIESSLL